MLAIALVTVILGNLGDWYSTHAALVAGAYEANPLARTLGNTGTKLLATVVLSLCMFFLKDQPGFLGIVTICLAIFYGWVFLHNLHYAR